MKSCIESALVLLLILLSSPVFAMGSVNVMTDSDLSIVITQIARNYTRDRETTVNTAITTPSMQQAQITEGGAADVLITPDAHLIESLKTQGLIDIYSQTAVAKNRLALVGPRDSPLEVNLAKKFPTTAIIRQLDGEPGFVVGSPDMLQEGVYGKEALRNMQAANDLEPYTLYIKELDQMFDMVTGHKAYGIFFYSSTIGHPDIRVLDLFPEETHKPIQYYAVVIAGDNMDEARKFLDYLKSPAVKHMFTDNGYFTD